MYLIEGMSAYRRTQITEALAQFLRRSDKDGTCSLLVLAEPANGGPPRIEVHGRWKADPVRLIGELAILKERLVKMASQERGTDIGTAT